MTVLAIIFIAASWFATVFVIGEAMEKAEKKLKSLKKASVRPSADLKGKVGQGGSVLPGAV